ncbi:MAG: YeeE/YedE thiosulfate transporter family protein [Sphingomonadaceae bacterium]
MTIVLIFLLVFVAGYITQRARTCAVSAAFEIVKRQRAHRLAGFLLAAACSFFTLSLLSLFGPGLFSGFARQWPSALTVIGGIIFAVGAWTNGRCSLGTIARLGSGDLSRIGTLVGMFAGIALSLSLFPPKMMNHEAMTLFANLSPGALIGIAAVNLAIFAYIVLKSVPADFNTAQWPIWQSMTIVGIINGLLVWLAHDWSYTSLFSHIAKHDVRWISVGSASFVVLIGGAVTGAMVSNQWHLRAGAPREWLLAAGGGVLMGVGIVLIPGGNDKMLLIGLPLVLPHLIIAYLVMYATLIGIATIAPDR